MVTQTASWCVLVFAADVREEEGKRRRKGGEGSTNGQESNKTKKCTGGEILHAQDEHQWLVAAVIDSHTGVLNV